MRRERRSSIFGAEDRSEPTSKLLLILVATAGFAQAAFAESRSRLTVSLSEAAKKEQKLILYSTMDLPQNIRVLHDFVQKYPFLDLEVHPLESGTLVERVRAEARIGLSGYDILIGGGGLLQPLLDENLLASYHSPQREGLSEALIDTAGYWSGYYINPLVLGYNTTMVKQEEVPKSYDELLDPRWRGRRIAIDGGAHGLLRGFAPVWGEDKAIAFLRRLAGQQPIMTRASISAVESMHTGDIAIVIARAPVIHGYKKKFSSPIDWVYLQPVVAQIDAVMVSSTSPHPHAARLFVDFILSWEGQNALTAIQLMPIRRDTEGRSKRARQSEQWFVERPDRHVNYEGTIKRFREIFGIQ